MPQQEWLDNGEPPDVARYLERGTPDPWPRTGTNTDFELDNGCAKRVRIAKPRTPPMDPKGSSIISRRKKTAPPATTEMWHQKHPAQFQKVSRHRVEMTTIGVTPIHHAGRRIARLPDGHVECVDCHNPHASNDTLVASPPSVSGSLKSVSA